MTIARLVLCAPLALAVLIANGAHAAATQIGDLCPDGFQALEYDDPVERSPGFVCVEADSDADPDP